MNQYTEHDKQSQNIQDYNQSPVMNPNRMVNNLIRSRSDDSVLIFGRMFSQTVEGQKQRPLIINFSNKIDENAIHDLKLFKKINKKERKKKQSDYCKNICGYIIKKIIRQFCSKNYINYIKQLCLKYNCQYKQIKNFYLNKIQYITGPSHIPSLLISNSEQQKNIKMLFREFCQWFVKNRYLRYLLIQGKMADKKAYIKYKNQILLSILNQNGQLKQNSLEQQRMEQSEQQGNYNQHKQQNKQQKQSNNHFKPNQNIKIVTILNQQQ